MYTNYIIFNFSSIGIFKIFDNLFNVVLLPEKLIDLLYIENII